MHTQCTSQGEVGPMHTQCASQGEVGPMHTQCASVGVTCLYLTVDRLPTFVISVTTTENCLSFAN